MNTEIIEQVSHLEEVRSNLFFRLLQNRIIFIDNLFSDRATTDIIAVLFMLDQEKEEKITIYINAEGGELRNVFAIYDTMQLLKSPLETCCIGAVMREATLLLAAGTKGYRFVSKNSDIGISQVITQYMSHSDLTNTKITHDKIIRDNETFLKEFAKNIGKSVKELKKDIERQLFLTPAQAVQYGIADKVI